MIGHPTSRFRRVCVLSLLMLLACQAAVWACPNCKDAMASDPAQAGLVRGFFWSILFMLSMPILILGGLSSYFYWEICRARRAAEALRASHAPDQDSNVSRVFVTETIEETEAEPAGVS